VVEKQSRGAPKAEGGASALKGKSPCQDPKLTLLYWSRQQGDATPHHSDHPPGEMLVSDLVRGKTPPHPHSCTQLQLVLLRI
jgi:hypothetical protein